MKTVAICNHKGGSGKTTTAYYLGHLLAESGLRTLLIDLDAQANLTGRFVFGPVQYTVADALGGAIAPRVGLEATVKAVARFAPLFLVPSEMQLANTAVGLLNDAVRGRTALKRALVDVAGLYDICLIDCPPEAGIMLVNALLAADVVICPGEPEIDALAGIGRVCEIVDDIRHEFERESPVLFGTIATRVDLRTNRHRDGLQTMEGSPLGAPLATVPESNGEKRDERLREAYGPVAAQLGDWARGQVR